MNDDDQIEAECEHGGMHVCRGCYKWFERQDNKFYNERRCYYGYKGNVL